MPKGNLVKFQTITSGDASGNLTSAVTQIQHLDDITVQVNVTGTPTGVLQVQYSLDFTEDFMNNVTNPGTWVNDIYAVQTVTAGNPTSTIFDLTLKGAPYVRLTWTSTSGTGTINAFISGKAV
jgi:hypothetical protein